MTDEAHNINNESNEQSDDPEDLADAYEALEEDRRQRAGLTSTDRTTIPDPSEDVVTEERAEPESPPEAAAVPVEAQANERVASEPARRVFLIDGKEYPDPDASLSITGARLVQSMYRDYFPGQLDNADVLQKTRPDGTLEVTFKRRIGTKGTRGGVRRRASTRRGEVAISITSVVGVLETL